MKITDEHTVLQNKLWMRATLDRIYTFLRIAK